MSEYNFSFDWARVTTLGKVKVLVEQVVSAPSQAAVNEAVRQYIEDNPGCLTPISDPIKSALLQIAGKVWYVDENGSTYYDALSDALYARNILSLSAVFTQGADEFFESEDLDHLRPDLVVTAYYDDGTSEAVSGYVLSGTLTAGTSTITASFLGESATFTVTVSAGVVIHDVDGDLLTYTSLTFASPPYYSDSTNRLSYTDFDLTIEASKTYRIIAYSDTPNADMSVHILNSDAIALMHQGVSMKTANADFAWRGTLDWTHEMPALINGYPPAVLRFSFKYTDDGTVSTKFISRILILEVTA